MNFFYSECIPGNYSATSFLDEAKRVMGGTYVNVNASSTADISIQPKLKFTSSYPFVLNMNNSSVRSSIGFDELSESTSKNYVYFKYKDNKRLFGSFYNSGSETWNLTAPNIIYLLGTRYCILKCPELEDHLYGSLAYDQRFSPGIGMFKLYAVNDVSHQRFDFLNFKKRNFHPVGKLDRLTFEFKRADGSMYDFKGANHLMLLNIKYLVPSNKNRKFQRSVLNPNYTADFNAYFTRHMVYKEPSDIDENEDRNVPLEFRKKYWEKERIYDYSSSDDGTANTDENDNDSEIDYESVIRH
jgi:hypothetical protein